MNIKKEYLKRYLLQQKKINRLNDMLNLKLLSRAEYKLQINECETIRKEIEERIHMVDGGILSEILFLKYTCGKNLSEISYIINYSQRQTERLHLKALEKFKL